jgi:hypothetical protein
MALPWQRRVVKPLDGDEGRRGAQPPCARRARAAPGLERPALVCLPLAILRDPGLPIVGTRLPGIDARGQDVAARRRVPDGVLARWRPRVSGMPPGGELTPAPLFVHHRAREVPSDGGFQGRDPHLRRVAVPCWQSAVAVTTVGPREACAAPGVLPPSAPGACGHLGALVRRHQPWPRPAPCARRTVATRMLEKAQRRLDLRALLAQEPLRRLGTGEPIRRPADASSELAAPGRVTQTVQGRVVQPCPAAASSAICMLRPQHPTVVRKVWLEHAPRTRAGAFVWRMTGRDSGLACLRASWSSWCSSMIVRAFSPRSD